MPTVHFQGVRKAFDGRAVLGDVDLTVAEGEYLALLGPSGGGKTTLVRLLAGLEVPDAGRISMDGRDLRDVDPADRGVALVFQGHALYPQLSARENLALPLRLRRLPAGEVARRVDATAASLGLTPLLDRLPETLSGGERQRVAVGRAVVGRTRVLLLDEPLSDLDPAWRARLRGWLRQVAAEHQLTVIHVTHDQREALSMGDRVAVLHRGVLQQVDTPDAVYRRPANAFVARFVGDPPMNLWRQPDGTWMGVRPEHLGWRPLGTPVSTGVVRRVESTGRDRWLVVAGGDAEVAEVVCQVPADATVPAPGSRVDLFAAVEHRRCFPSGDLPG